MLQLDHEHEITELEYEVLEADAFLKGAEQEREKNEAEKVKADPLMSRLLSFQRKKLHLIE